MLQSKKSRINLTIFLVLVFLLNNSLYINTNDFITEIKQPHQSISDYITNSFINHFLTENNTVYSPNKVIRVVFELNEGSPTYTVYYNNHTIIQPSHLGFRFKKQPPMISNFSIVELSHSRFDETWKPLWGQSSLIRNQYNELSIELIETQILHRELHIIFRAFNDGIAFRYFLPKQDNLSSFEITSEESHFSFPKDCTAWWIPADFDSYEHLYQSTSLSEAINSGVNTPITLETSEGYYISLHEANLTDWAGMTLGKTSNNDLYTFKSELVPWFGTDIKVKAAAPHFSPWRTIQITDSLTRLTQSNLILNLNDPCILSDTSWITPMKYMGIWWGMHLGIWTWEEGPKHGATTEQAKKYIDSCVELHCDSLLVEGWNTGWSRWDNQDFTTPTADYDIEEVIKYGKSKNVTIIGHIETGGNTENYESQGIDTIFSYFNELGINTVKTGYAGVFPDFICNTEEGNQHHHGQWMVNHYRRVLESAAKYKIMLDVHEPIKPTGISRTYPNMMTREGVRGQEYNAWGDPPNPPEHITILPFTRCLAGPVDYTPGVFDLESIENKFSTVAHQLALYVILYSPVQMVCDLKESYYSKGKLKEGCQFIQNVPVSWEESLTLDSEIGDYVTIARKHNDNWYIGCITDENSRTLDISLDFLDSTKNYTAYLYVDDIDSDYESNPEELKTMTKEVTNLDTLEVSLQRGGGFAAEIIPSDQITTTKESVSGFTYITILFLPIFLIVLEFKRQK